MRRSGRKYRTKLRTTTELVRSGMDGEENTCSLACTYTGFGCTLVCLNSAAGNQAGDKGGTPWVNRAKEDHRY